MHGLYSLFGKDKDSKHQQQKQSEEGQAKYFATGSVFDGHMFYMDYALSVLSLRCVSRIIKLHRFV